jgi:hypothetical protein
MITKLIGNNDSNKEHLQNFTKKKRILNDGLTCNHNKKYVLLEYFK